MSDGMFTHLVAKHTCFSGEAHNSFGRIHLPVSPACNIQYRFYKRGLRLNKRKRHPGENYALLNPEEAVGVVEKALELYPQITVAGIAGPGDTLASDHALETFELIHRKFPLLLNCLSTNGLLLKEKVERAFNAGVRTITVTVNSVNLKVLKNIFSYIMYNGQYMTGELAARWLILAQLSGIEKAAKLGAVVKINTFLVPGVNDRHIGEVARVTSEVGASLINVIPLMSHLEIETNRPLACHELNAARKEAEKYLPVFRYCQQCRADVCGIPGSGIEFADVFYDHRPKLLRRFRNGSEKAISKADIS
jgi:nitrogen fixation protein NifB